MKYVYQILLLIVFIALLSACDNNDKPKTDNPNGLEISEVRYMGSAGEVILLELAEELGYLAPLKTNYIGVASGGPQGIQTVLTGDVEISSEAFNGAIAKSIASGAPIKAVIAAYGNLEKPRYAYYVLNDSEIKTPRDLIGKKIAVNSLGAQMEFVVTEYLLRAGLTKDEIKQVTFVVVPVTSGEQVLRQKQVDVAPLFDLALERGGVRELFKDYDLYGGITVGSHVMSNKFIKENPKAAKHIVGALAKTIEWTRERPNAEVIAKMQEIVKKRNRNENDGNLKYWHGWGIAGKGGLMSDDEFQRWIDWLVKDGQVTTGQIKPSDLYTNVFNPYSQP
jgi:ABC-type nitrate/sulfonate/bicarbonate transport system substrate-binding protein